MYYLPDILTHTLEESLENLSTAINEATSLDREKFFLTIVHRETGEFIGTIGYTVAETTPLGKFVDTGYFILPEHHGKGYLTEALRKLICFAFETDNVFRISTGCLAENLASERVMQKCGLIKEAERKSYTWHDGQMKDRVEYRLLKDEWVARTEVMDDSFWLALDNLVAESEIVIDRPAGSTHPHYTEFIYPLDYGYLKNTSSMDGDGIDIWRGTDTGEKISAIICAVDLLKRDSEIKLLIGCTEKEKITICQAHNASAFMKGVLIRRS